MQEFIKQEGLDPMLKLLAITPLAAESSYANANTAIIDTCRNILVGTAIHSCIYAGAFLLGVQHQYSLGYLFSSSNHSVNVQVWLENK